MAVAIESSHELIILIHIKTSDRGVVVLVMVNVVSFVELLCDALIVNVLAAQTLLCPTISAAIVSIRVRTWFSFLVNGCIVYVFVISFS